MACDLGVATGETPEPPALKLPYSQAKRQKIGRLSTLRAIHQLQETKSVAHVFRHRAEHRLLLFHFRRGFGFIFIGKVVLLDGRLQALTNVLTPIPNGNVWLMLPLLAGDRKSVV